MWAWHSAPVRMRLTAWYAAVLTATLIAYATATFLAVRHEFLEQLDDQLRDDAEAAEAVVSRAPDGRYLWPAGREPVTSGDDLRTYEVWSPDGELIQAFGTTPALPAVAVGSTGPVGRYDTIVAGGEWRTLTTRATIGDRPVVVRVARSQGRLQAQLREIAVVLVLGAPLVVLLAGVGGYVLARGALAPIDHLASEAERITADRLHERLTSPNQADEIGRLTTVINATFARLEASFGQLRRFTADASHELRTPLAVLRGIGEAVVAERRDAPAYEEAIGSMLEEVDRMSRLVDTLLRLSHGDAGTIRLVRERLDAGELARQVASSLAILAEERQQTVSLDVADGVIVEVDRLVMREAIANILDNAIKYGPSGSTVGVRVGRSDDRAVLAILDQGPGVAAADRERIFDRFYRVDEARSRVDGGAGLGLAIAKWAVELHGGRITVDQRPGGGSEFRIVLPLAPLAARDESGQAAIHVGGRP